MRTPSSRAGKSADSWRQLHRLGSASFKHALPGLPMSHMGHQPTPRAHAEGRRGACVPEGGQLPDNFYSRRAGAPLHLQCQPASSTAWGSISFRCERMTASCGEPATPAALRCQSPSCAGTGVSCRDSSVERAASCIASVTSIRLHHVVGAVPQHPRLAPRRLGCWPGCLRGCLPSSNTACLPSVPWAASGLGPVLASS